MQYLNLSFGETLHKAMSTCLHRIVEENQKSGETELRCAGNSLPDDNAAISTLIASMRNALLRGYASHWWAGVQPGFFTLGISLFGSVAGVLPYLLPRCKNLFSEIGFHNIELVSVCDGQWRPLHLRSGKLTPVPVQFNAKSFAHVSPLSGKLQLEFISPVSLYNNHRHAGNMAFGDLVYHLCKRMSNIEAVYCNGKDCSKDVLKQQCEAWNYEFVLNEAQIVWQQTLLSKRMPLGGYTGKLVYGAHPKAIEQWLPLLLLGSYVQAGSATNYGMGKYTVSHECYRVM